MDFWAIVSTLFVIGCLGIYFQFFRKIYIFHRAGIPYSTPWPIFGNLTALIFQKTSLSQLLKSIYNLSPDAKYVGFFEFSTPVILIRDPDIIKSVTIKNFDTFTNRQGFANESEDKLVSLELFSAKDENWHKIRNLLSPSFTSSKMKIMFSTIAEKSEQLVNLLIKEEAVEMEMRKLFQRLITEVMASCAYGVNANCIEDEKDEFYMIGSDAVDMEKINRKRLLLKYLPLVWKCLGMSFIDKHVMKYFKNIVECTVTERREKNIFRPNMIHLMIDAVDRNINNNEISKGISIEQMTAEAAMIFIASFHTSSEVFTYFFYEMAINPEIQERLQKEIDSLWNHSSEKRDKSVINDENLTDRKITFQDINSLKYLDAVLKETLRLHTVILFLERVCSKDFVLPPATPGSKSLTLKPGMLLWIPSEAIHHDPNNYEDPKKFDPERFLKEEEKTGCKASIFLPFGIGPRQCIAYRFAMLIFKVVIFHFLARCSVQVCSKTPIPLCMVNTMTKVLKNEIWLQIVERQKTSEKCN